MVNQILEQSVNGVWCITAEELQGLQLKAVRHFTGARIAGEMPDGADPELPSVPAVLVGRVAVIQVNGVLGKNLSDGAKYYCGGVDYDDICEQIEEAEADPTVRAIVFHFRSPGGMALGCAECGDRIAAIENPTVAYTDYCMASGAYWLGAQCDAIYSSGSAFLGSIGVMAAYFDWSKAFDAMGVKVNAFSAGKWKMAGAPFKPMTDEERSMFQDRTARYYAQFTAAVNQKRKIAPENMEGQLFDGAQAVDAGLCDGIFPCLDDLLLYLNTAGPELTSPGK